MRHLRLIMGALALMLSTVMHAAVGDTFTIDQLTYTVLTEKASAKTGTASVKAADTSISGAITIPSTVVNGAFTYTVNTVVASGFKDCTGITSVTLPETITKLNNYAFSGCSALTSFNIPSKVTTIPTDCFWKCVALEYVTIPNTVTKINSYAFGQCTKLKSVVMSENVTTIPTGCFINCNKMTSINLSKIKTINGNAFNECASLTEISLDSLKTLSGSYQFQECSNLKTVVLGENLTKLNQGCFDGCSKLENINLENIVTIGVTAFSGCNALKNLTWSDNLKSIGDQAFSGHKGLVNVVIPNSVETIGNRAFLNCNNLESINIPNHLKAIPAGFIEVQDGRGTSKVENIEISTSVKKIGAFAFAANNIRVLKIPNSVDTIYYCTLYSCNSIHMTLPSWLKVGDWGIYNSVGSRFGSNRGPKELTFPAYVEEINYAYQGEQAKSIYVMGNEILPNTAKNTYESTIYVKKSVFLDKYADGVWNDLPVSYQIPISMTNNSGNPIEYKTLCRDFDVDLTHTNDNLPEGVEPLRAYLVEDVDGDLRMVFLNEIKYIPSRLKANTTDSEGNRYQGVDEYVGVVLRGTPGYTYYYEMGEHDYTQGAEGQWLLEDAMAYSGTTYDGNLMAGDANDEFYVYRTVEDADNNEVINYGLNNNRFKIYYKEGWLMYNKAYLQLPKYVSDAIEADTDAEGNANLTFMFQNADGTTTKVSSVEFARNSESDIFYNPYGQRVNANTKGIVINNGRKFVNK